MKNLRELKKYRSKEATKKLLPPGTSWNDAGVFYIPLNETETAQVIADNGVTDPAWEHISVSTDHRCLTWDEMCMIKDMFFDPSERVVQYHPPKDEYVDIHPFCLHLWRWTLAPFPAPPKELVM